MPEITRPLRSLVTVLFFAGCHSMSCCTLDRTVEGDERLELQDVTEPALDVHTANGSITVEQGSGPGAVIEARVRARTEERLRQVAIVATPHEDGRLEVFARFPEKRYGDEGCSFRVIVPATRSVKARTSNGHVELKGLSGPAELVSSNGRITVEGHEGALHLRTSNGSIRVREASSTIVATTSNGGVTIELRDAAKGPVVASTSNGRIELVVGGGFSGELEARTSNGRIETRLPDTVELRRRDRHHVVLGFPGKGEGSELTTGNGSIVVRVR